MRNLLLVSSFLLATGCGGSGSGGGGARNLDGFIGTWEGSYQERGGERRSGTLRITLERGAPVVFYAGGAGRIVDSARGEGDADVGLTQAGRLSVTYGFGTLGGQFNYAGRPRIDARGHLVGALAYTESAGELLNDIDLAPVAP